MTNDTKADEITAKYISLRDFKEKVDSEYKAKLAKVNEAMEKIETEMLTFLRETGQESSKTKSGTFFLRTSTSARVADWDVALKFIMDNDMTNMLEKRVNKTAVEEYISVHGEVPPGVDITRKVDVSVNRPKARG